MIGWIFVNGGDWYGIIPVLWTQRVPSYALCVGETESDQTSIISDQTSQAWAHRLICKVDDNLVNSLCAFWFTIPHKFKLKWERSPLSLLSPPFFWLSQPFFPRRHRPTSATNPIQLRYHLWRFWHRCRHQHTLRPKASAEPMLRTGSILFPVCLLHTLSLRWRLRSLALNYLKTHTRGATLILVTTLRLMSVPFRKLTLHITWLVLIPLLCLIPTLSSTFPTLELSGENLELATLLNRTV